eukprot:scaffold273796_cov31-Tisochrysis_lutea.AAC.8
MQTLGSASTSHSPSSSPVASTLTASRSALEPCSQGNAPPVAGPTVSPIGFNSTEVRAASPSQRWDPCPRRPRARSLAGAAAATAMRPSSPPAFFPTHPLALTAPHPRHRSVRSPHVQSQPAHQANRRNAFSWPAMEMMAEACRGLAGCPLAAIAAPSGIQAGSLAVE